MLTWNCRPAASPPWRGERGGKTTLARLLVGLARPESGRILINGQDLTMLAPDSWRSRLAWVPQVPYFTSGTVRENLLLGRPDADQNQINTALEAAAAGNSSVIFPMVLTPSWENAAPDYQEVN